MRVTLDYVCCSSVFLIGFALTFLTSFLGAGATFLIFLCGVFGIHEFQISRGWKEEKKKKLRDGELRENLREDVGLMKRYALYVSIPITIYCVTLYVIYKLCDGNAYAAETLSQYLKTNNLLHQISQSIYPTILTHSSAIAVTEDLKAETIRHIYSILFNLPIFSLFSFVPSIAAWVTQAYVFETRSFKKPFCAFGVLFLSANSLMLIAVGDFLRNAPLFLSGRRFSYNVLENENFWIWLIVFSYIFFLGFSYCLTLLIAYAMTYAKGPSLIFNSKDT